MKRLHEIWENNGFPAATRLWSILKHQKLTDHYNRGEVEKYIAQQKVSQLHHRPKVSKHSHITTTAPGIMYCIDLLDMTPYSRDNGGVKWLLLCIDIFSRRAVIVAANNKTATVISEALNEACKEFGVYPKVILSDKGSEFKGATAKLLAKHSIIHRTAEVGDHRRLGIVDRFSGVVKGWISKNMTHKQTTKYVGALSGFLKKYNNAPHSSLGGMSPNEAWEFPSEALDFHYTRIQKGIKKQGKKPSGEIEVGSWVRVLKLKGMFDKGYHVKYSLTPHKVVEIKGLNYVLDNDRFYRAARLLKVPAPEEEAPVRDVGRAARRERKNDLILQQEGVDPVANPEIRRSARLRKPSSQLEDARYGNIKY
jgi:transposase InsO family protein